MTTPGPHRWSDDKLEEFYADFRKHIRSEDDEQRQQQQMFEALFRVEDVDKNVTPGVVQLMVRTAADVKQLRIAAERQRTFIGGVLFALTTIWFVVTDVGPIVIDKLKKLF